MEKTPASASQEFGAKGFIDQMRQQKREQLIIIDADPDLNLNNRQEINPIPMTASPSQIGIPYPLVEMFQHPVLGFFLVSASLQASEQSNIEGKQSP
jgi:hypothetical protein